MGKPFWEKSSVWKGVTNGYNDFKGKLDAHNDRWQQVTSGNSNYSDFVSKANEATNGWYSTISGATPIVSGVHNALLGRDSALDYLNNTGLSWSDLPGYQSSRLTAGASAGINDIGRDFGKIADGVNDLHKFYSGENPSPRKPVDPNSIFR